MNTRTRFLLLFNIIFKCRYEKTKFCKLNEYINQRCKARNRPTKITPEDHTTSTTRYSNAINMNEELRRYGVTNGFNSSDIWIAM